MHIVDMKQLRAFLESHLNVRCFKMRSPYYSYPLTFGMSFVEALRANQNMTDLNISGYADNLETMNALSHVFAQCHNLTRLAISNVYNNSDDDELSLREFVSFLQSSVNLTDLSITNRFRNAQMIQLATGIGACKTLRSVNVSENLFNQSGMHALADAIQLNKNITCLNVSYIDVSGEGLVLLSHALCATKKLVQLNMAVCQLTNADVRLVAKILASNPDMERLILPSNMLNDESLHHLTQAIQKHPRIHHVNLFHNRISCSGALNLIQAFLKKTPHDGKIYINLEMNNIQNAYVLRNMVRPWSNARVFF